MLLGKNLSSRASMSFNQLQVCLGQKRKDIFTPHIFLVQEIKSVLFLTSNNLKLIQRQHIAKYFSFRISILLDQICSFTKKSSPVIPVLLSFFLVFSILYYLSFVNSQTLILLFSYSVDLFCFQHCVGFQIHKV